MAERITVDAPTRTAGQRVKDALTRDMTVEDASTKGIPDVQ
jgi:hypothetical protein